MPGESDRRFDHTVHLDDGRVLGYGEVGDPDGSPLIWFHGTPSSRLEVTWLDDPAARAGWRLVAFDRPGHGLSSPVVDPSADLSALASDVAALADHLGIDRFTTVGYSGGAPFALATAAALGDRVAVVGLVSPWGPPDRPGAYAGVARSERWSDDVARRWPWATRVQFAGLGAVIRLAPKLVARLLGAKLEGSPLLGSDTGSLASETIGPLREALRQGGAGAARDLHLIVSPWGFDPRDVRAPVRVWHGDEDPEIPIHHGEYLAATVADGSLSVLAGGDHLALFVQGDQILADLASALR
jgi:pimeloyl-ACP methyl ester carboxylesterase